MADLSTFRSALSTHLAAIEARDTAAFEATLTVEPNLTFVALTGATSTSKESFVKAMRAWLADADWSWKLEEVSLHADASVGVAVYRVNYRDLDPQGKPYTLNYVLSLVFARQGAQWRLVHDQNTRVAGS